MITITLLSKLLQFLVSFATIALTNCDAIIDKMLNINDSHTYVVNFNNCTKVILTPLTLDQINNSALSLFWLLNLQTLSLQAVFTISMVFNLTGPKICPLT